MARGCNRGPAMPSPALLGRIRRDVGCDDGWGAAYDGAFDAGFYARVDYHLYGDFVEPKYALQFSRRSTALTSRNLAALNAPEPASLVLVGVAVAFGLLRRPGRGRRG